MTAASSCLVALAFIAAMRVGAVGAAVAGRRRRSGSAPGVELINVTATVTDGNGRFVSGLRKEDFRVFQDEQPQPITHFNSERVPVSLGIVLDTSGSMDGRKDGRRRSEALNRFLFDLLGPDDEVFLYRFDSSPELVTAGRPIARRVSRGTQRIRPRGGTAMYDAVAEAIPLAQAGSTARRRW